MASARRLKLIPKLVNQKTSPTKDGSSTKSNSTFSDTKEQKGRYRTSTPASSAYSCGLKFDPKFDDGTNISAFPESESEVESTRPKMPITAQSKRAAEQALNVDIAHARYIQALYLDVTMKNYISQHKKDETTYLTQLTLLVSNLSDHLAYLERMSMAAKHQKEVQEVIERQEIYINKVKNCLESSMEPFKTLMYALECTRHNIQFEGICLDQEELRDLSAVLDKADLVLQQLIQMFSACNLVKAAKSYSDLEASLQKAVGFLKQCRDLMNSVENSIVETSTAKLQLLHKSTK